MSSRALHYDPSQFLELAERLLEDGRYEVVGRSRTAIGRAYYAAFLMVKTKLEAVGCSFSDADKIHAQVIITVNEKNSAIGNKLETLRKYRVEADYEMGARVNVDISKKCVKISRQVMLSLNQIQ